LNKSGVKTEYNGAEGIDQSKYTTTSPRYVERKRGMRD